MRQNENDQGLDMDAEAQVRNVGKDIDNEAGADVDTEVGADVDTERDTEDTEEYS